MRRHYKKLAGILMAIVGIAVIASACSQATPTTRPQTGGPTPTSGAITGPRSNNNTSYKQKTLSVTLTGTTVKVPVASVAGGNTNFGVNANGNYMTFMAYQLDGKYFVRADICPPCGSRSFTLQSGKIICDACGTVFNATSGAAVSGACVAYPKAIVKYTVEGDSIVLNVSDLTTAYQKTLSRQGLS